MKSLVYFACILMLLLTACTSKQGKNEIQHTLSRLDLQESLNVSTDSLSRVTGGRIRGIAVDSRGNIYLADDSQAKIQVVSPNGRYLESIGQRGRGPGEFMSLDEIYIYNNILYVLDVYLNRLSEFSLGNDQFLRTVKFPDIHLDNQPIGTPSGIFPLSDGRYELVFSNIEAIIPDAKITVSILNHNLEPVDTVIRQFPPSRPFLYRDTRSVGVFNSLSRSTFVAFGQHGHVYETNADSMHIRVFDSNGKKIRNILAGYIPPPLTHSDLDSIASEMSPSRKNMFYKALDQNKVSNHWPALQDLLVDDQGRCWVELVTPGKKQHTWWVFDSDGNPKWEFKLSRHIKLYVIRNKKVYGIWNKEGEYPRIVQYHIEGI